jgi:hypothetical protein
MSENWLVSLPTGRAGKQSMDNLQLWKIGHHIRVKPGTGGIRAGMGRQDGLAGHQMGPHASVHYEAWPKLQHPQVPWPADGVRALCPEATAAGDVVIHGLGNSMSWGASGDSGMEGNHHGPCMHPKA